MITRTTECFLSTIRDHLPQFVGYKEDKHTHTALCTLAANWLIRNHKCRAVLIERGTGSGEMPDVIGWYFDDSFLVEAKITRADFLSDFKKPHRSENAMGLYRYYICPQGLISPDEVPQSWGLLYVTKGGLVKKQKDADPFPDRNKDKEFVMLTSALASPWKLFQHWSDGCIEHLSKLNFMSPTMGTDISLFCARLAVNRILDEAA